MRYEKGHKQETRQRVIETAARRFRQDGIEATGVAALMAAAGLTHGGFYAHFASKDDLVAEAIGCAFENSRTFLGGKTGEKPTLEGFVNRYLSVRHRDHPDQGCVAAALASEIRRHSPETRARFTASLREALSTIAHLLPEAIRGKARVGRAQATFSVMLGALQLSRAVDDPALSESILAEGRKAALSLAGVL